MLIGLPKYQKKEDGIATKNTIWTSSYMLYFFLRFADVSTTLLKTNKKYEKK